MEQLLTPKHLAELLQVKLSTVFKWTHFGYIPYIKMGDLIRFREKRIEQWLDKRLRKGRVSYRLDIDS